MALTTEQIESVKKMMDEFIEEHRPPVEIRSKLDIGWRLVDQSVYLFEIRPDWLHPDVIRHSDYAKATWLKTQRHWKVYWQRANGDWNHYEPLDNVVNLQRFLIEVEKDPHHCFRG